MFLVIVAIAFLWVMQIWLFEPNYVDTTMKDLTVRVEQNAKDLSKLDKIDPNDSDNPIKFLSKTIIGLVFLTDKDGNILYAYNNGREMEPSALEHDYSWLTDRSAEVISGTNLSFVEKFSKTSAIIVGVKSSFKEKPVALLMYNTITQTDSLQRLNRRQLLIFSLVLTLVASIISFLLSIYFSKPITKIKNSVTDMTLGKLDSTTDVKRNDELGELSESVNELGKELQRVEVLRKEVIANISHELRTPLALITGYGEMVRDVTGGDEEKRRNNMDLIISEANRLSQMVDDIMDYSIMQAGYSDLNLEVSNLFSLIESCVLYANEVGQRYDISIVLRSFSSSIPLEMDTLKMSQVLRNLLNNAINHTPGGETILVDIVNEDSSIRVSITNPGQDIPPEQIDEIWERYQRVQHQGGHKEGTGIGLAIVSTILSAHNMTYGVTSANGVTSFWFCIPNRNI
ncbi:HAMP domain-containing sensor histidine kinase [Enterococcus sp.]|uniref:HAMP domain-containing sensor histidine kinase n=1 Tax=Enterococcus sp. TaxID=35783 RepID=UPI00290B5D41|nr:HAMP domain-containing sensor histidine kinase [Enterococcus sp.]MDU5336724.1 HAMP domain-containing sensor histidine kinase [Enterococcus sp.]